MTPQPIVGQQHEEPSVDLAWDIGTFYAVMDHVNELVYTNAALAEAEVQLALRLMGHVPTHVLLPCAGCGRHIEPLLQAGVTAVHGVDLTQGPLEAAKTRYATDKRVTIEVADMIEWVPAGRSFDAVLLLGNSFGDVIAPLDLEKFTRSMLTPLQSGGHFVMDYIGEGFLDRCGKRSRWTSRYQSQDVWDYRARRYDKATQVMITDISLCEKSTDRALWSGQHMKRILDDASVTNVFARHGLTLVPHGKAEDLHHTDSFGDLVIHELGMIAQSTWWAGRKV